MTKNKIKVIIWVSVLFLITLGLVFTAPFLLEMSGFTQTDFRIYDNFVIPSPAITQCSIKTTNLAFDECVASDSNWIVDMGRVGGTDGVTRTVATSKYVSDGVVLSAMDSGFYQITTAKSLKDNDFRLSFEVFKNCDPDINIRFNGEGGTQIFNNLDLPPGAVASRCIESTTSYIIEGVHSILNDTMFIFVNGQERASVPITNGNLFVQIKAGYQPRIELKLKSLQIKNFLSCDVDADEVAIKDVFTEGSTFDVDDLTYPIKHLCPTEYPFVLRGIEGGVRADVKEEMVNILNRGESITVPQGKIIEAHYIADFKEGMGERCKLGFALTKAKICEQVIFEAPDVIEIIRDVRFLEVGVNQVRFINQTTIGDKSISSSDTEYLCSGETGESIVTSPNPRSECWQTTVSHPFGQSFTIKDGEEKMLNGWFNIRFIADAKWDGSDAIIKKDNRNLIFVIKDRGFITTEAIKDDKFFVLLNSDKNIQFKIDNKLPINFNKEQSGVNQKITTDLLTTQRTELINLDIKQGVNTYSVKGDTSALGEILYQNTPYISIGQEKIFDDSEVLFNYFVQTKEQFNQPKPQTQFVNVTKFEEKIVKEEILSPYVKWMIGGLSLLIVIGIIYIFTKKKGRR